MEKYKLAILTSHPIQYQTPLFKKLAENSEIDLTVYFNWDFGVKNSYDCEFGKEVKWDIPLLNGYKYKFLRNFSLRPSSGFWGQINLGIIKELIGGKYDTILIFGWNSFANWLVFLTAFIFKIPIILRGENPLNQELSKPKWKIKIKKIILGNLFKHIVAFLYIGKENKKFYQYYGVPENKLIFVPYAIDNDRFMAASELLKGKRKMLRKKIGIGKDDIAVLFVGKLIEKKRPMDLLLAYQQLTTNNKQLKNDACLLYIGDGILREYLEKYVKKHNLKNVHFTGFKNQTELPEYYVISDILVLPSGEGETWGLVVNEAMCFGLSVIVSDRVGCGPDLIKQGENGYIFQVGNIDELAERLEIIFDEVKMKKFGEKSFESVQNYSFNHDVDKITEIIKNLKLNH